MIEREAARAAGTKLTRSASTSLRSCAYSSPFRQDAIAFLYNSIDSGSVRKAVRMRSDRTWSASTCAGLLRTGNSRGNAANHTSHLSAVDKFIFVIDCCRHMVSMALIRKNDVLDTWSVVNFEQKGRAESSSIVQKLHIRSISMTLRLYCGGNSHSSRDRSGVGPVSMDQCRRFDLQKLSR